MRTRLITALTLTGTLMAGVALAAEPSAPSTNAPSTTLPATSAPSMMDKSSTGMTENENGDKMSTASGVIRSFDAKSHMIVLKNGSKFWLDEDMKGDDLQPGQKATFTCEKEGKHNVVTHYDIKS